MELVVESPVMILPGSALQPEAGDICQLLILEVSQTEGAAGFIQTPLIDVFVKVRLLVIQTTVSGEMLKFAFGFLEI
jgi:hypothetical protein